MRKRRSCGSPPKDSRAVIEGFEDSEEWVIHVRYAAVSAASATPWLNVKLIRDGYFAGRCNYWLAYRLDTKEWGRNNQSGHLASRSDVKGQAVLADAELAVAGWVAENPHMVETQPAPSVDFSDLMK